MCARIVFIFTVLVSICFALPTGDNQVASLSTNAVENQADAIRIMSITPADVDQLRRLYHLSLLENFDGFVQDPAFHGDIYDRAVSYQQNNGDMIGLFDEKNTLLGFGSIKQIQDNGVELGNLHVHPDYQGKGFGKKLTVALIEIARNRKYDTVQLHVTETQKKAMGLYNCLGFIETSRQTFDISGQTFDTHIMELRLAPATVARESQ